MNLLLTTAAMTNFQNSSFTPRATTSTILILCSKYYKKCLSFSHTLLYYIAHLLFLFYMLRLYAQVWVFMYIFYVHLYACIFSHYLLQIFPLLWPFVKTELVAYLGGDCCCAMTGHTVVWIPQCVVSQYTVFNSPEERGQCLQKFEELCPVWHNNPGPQVQVSHHHLSLFPVLSIILTMSHLYLQIYKPAGKWGDS